MAHDMSPEAIKARIAQWCEWFDLTPPKLTVRRGAVYLTDDLHAWLVQAGASFDWILCGDMRIMATTYRAVGPIRAAA